MTCDYAKMAAELGYVGFVVDMYGNANVATDLDSCIGYINPFLDDRVLLRGRINAAYKTICDYPMANADKVVGIGFCFGGMCLLGLARSGADIKGVVSAHGVFQAPDNIPNETISAKVLLCHGYGDPQVPPEQLAAPAKEMDGANVDWQCHFYGQTKHAFTDPHASEIGPPEMGRVYSKKASSRVWQTSKQFFSEVFAD